VAAATKYQSVVSVHFQVGAVGVAVAANAVAVPAAHSATAKRIAVTLRFIVLFPRIFVVHAHAGVRRGFLRTPALV
jgi:hypothetical protein